MNIRGLKQSKNNKQGFSLMEILVALGIFLFVIIIIWMFVKQSYSVQSFTSGQTTAITEAQRGVEKLVKEAREALPGDTGAYAIEKANDNELIFYADYDRDLAVEKVRYYLDGSNFIKAVIEPTGNPLEYLSGNETTAVISQYVRNETIEPVFTYYNGDYPTDITNNPMLTPADVLNLRLIHVYLKINVFPGQAPKDFDLESDVQIRNLKDNL